MPWRQINPMSERLRFVACYEEGFYSMTELCERFSISRKTGYKWLARFRAEGLDGLKERSRAPTRCPHRTDEAVEELLLEERRAHPHWGPRKILDRLRPLYPDLVWPAPSTVGDIFARHDLIVPHRRKRTVVHPGASTLCAEQPNAVWTADFKGQFLLTNRRYCYPLTVCDACTRYLLACRGLASTKTASARGVFEEVFRRFGLPEVIRTDNGVPFASIGLHGLSSLNIWWIKLGIVHERIMPGQPQQNGRHERMHRTLKQETTFPREHDMATQQTRFDAFRIEYNEIRPHEALQGKTPASLYTPSGRPYPDHLAKADYPGHAELRLVSSAGTIRFRSKQYFISETLAGETLALEEVEDGIWNLFFYRVLLGRLNQHTQTLHL